MQRWAIRRILLVSALAAAVLSLPAAAGAGPCGSVSITPNQGWPGAPVTISGSGFPPGDPIYINWGEATYQAATVANASGAFSHNFSIPGDFPAGQTNYFVYGNSGCGHQNAVNYTVLASAPTTTTSPPPPTTAAPTTTTAASTTTAAPTTTLAQTTTTAAATTTTDVDDTTTTLVAGDSSSQSWMIWVIVALAVIAALLAGMMLGQRRRAGGTNPPPPPE